MASIYIHIPYCLQKCAYCDFASYPVPDGAGDRGMARYLNALEEETADARARYGRFPVETVFIGGGTPSLLSGAELARIAEGLRAQFDLNPLTEFTIEANPGTVTAEKLNAYRAAGANRISFGAQAMQQRLLENIGRIHTWPDAVEAVRLARGAGFGNISIDLMYGLPGQTKADFVETLGAAVSLGIEHLSCYSLILEENTPLYARAARGEVVIPDEDAVIGMQKAAIDCLESSGYARYEISNYARAGYACAHNIVYWTRGDYLGLGCAAHSLMRGERFENDREIGAYIGGVRGLNGQRLSSDDEREEAVMLETRMTAGLDLDAYRKRYGEDFTAAHRRGMEKLRKLELIDWDENRLYLTEKGFFVHNTVVLELLNP